MRLDHSSCKVMNLQSRREKNETAFEKVERANETFAVYRCCKPRKPNEFSSRSSTKITCSELLLHLPLAHCQTDRLPKHTAFPKNTAFQPIRQVAAQRPPLVWTHATPRSPAAPGDVARDFHGSWPRLTCRLAPCEDSPQSQFVPHYGMWRPVGCMVCY